jgi:hypothetical protein
MAALAVALVLVAEGTSREITAAVRNLRRSDFQITLFEVLVITTCVAIFFAARSYLSPPRRGDNDLFIVKQFALFWAVFVAAGLALAWRQHRWHKVAEALRLKASETPMQFEAVDGNETIDDIVSAVDACPICSAPVGDRGECIGTGSSTLATSPGNIRRTTCRECRAPLQGIGFYGGSPLVDASEPNGKRSIRWETHITRKRPPDEVSMVVEQSDR